MLQATAVSKSFFSNKVLDSVDIDVRRGEVHGLVGENGAGKSTLINIIGGILQRDSGAIVFDGQEVNFAHPLEAMGAGISVVHQELSLVPNATVTENIFLRREKRNASRPERLARHDGSREPRFSRESESTSTRTLWRGA